MDIVLSSGVVVSLVAGIFSLVTVTMNARRVSRLEKDREQFRIHEMSLEMFRSAYSRFLEIKGPFDILRPIQEGGVGSDLFQDLYKKSENAARSYVELMNSVKPYMDDDLYMEWVALLVAHDEAIKTNREEIAKRGSVDSEAIVSALLNMESGCEELLERQIKRLCNRSSRGDDGGTQ